MQREAAEKYSGTKRDTQASVLLRPWYDFRIVHSFSRADFDPVPSVEVVLLDIEKRHKPLVSAPDAELYRKFVIYGYSRQRANLGKSYKKVFSHLQWKRLADDLGFDVHAQPTDLAFEHWLGVFQFFTRGVRSGFVRAPSEMLASETSGATPTTIGRIKTGRADERWKHRKAKQPR